MISEKNRLPSENNRISMKSVLKRKKLKKKKKKSENLLCTKCNKNGHLNINC